MLWMLWITMLCRKVGAQLLLTHFRRPLTDAYSPAWHPSPRSGPPSQAFRPLLSLFLLRYQSTSSQPKHATISWENVTVPWEDILMGEWAKEGKDCKNSPEKSMFAFMPQLRTIALSKRTDYLPLPVSPISTTLVHIIPLLEISSCQNPTHQNVHQYFGRAIWQTLAEMKMTHLWSSNSIFGKCPRNILAPEHKEICAKKCLLHLCLKDQEPRNNLNVYQLKIWF